MGHSWGRRPVSEPLENVVAWCSVASVAQVPCCFLISSALAAAAKHHVEAAAAAKAAKRSEAAAAAAAAAAPPPPPEGPRPPEVWVPPPPPQEAPPPALPAPPEGDIPNSVDQPSLGRKAAEEWKCGKNKEIHLKDIHKKNHVRWRWVGECQQCRLIEVSVWGIGDVTRISGWSKSLLWCPACMGYDVLPKADQPPPPQPTSQGSQEAPPPPQVPPPSPPLRALENVPSASLTSSRPAPPAEPPGLPTRTTTWLEAAGSIGAAAAATWRAWLDQDGLPINWLFIFRAFVHACSRQWHKASGK